MKTRTIILGLTAIIMVIGLSACSSTRYVSTLKPSGDKALQLGAARFSIVALSDKPGEVAYAQQITQRAKGLYPNLFTDEWAGLPVAVKIDTSSDSSMNLAAFLTGFCTLGTIPFPGTEKTKYSVDTNLINTLGERVPAGKVAFEFDKVMWMTVSSPLGLLPVPGISDLPRDYQMLFFNFEKNIEKATTKQSDYRTDCLVEAVVKTLRTADQAKLADDYRVRKTRLQEVMIDGKPYWSFLAPTFSQQQDRAESFTALIYQDYPKRGAPPLEQVVVARRDAPGAWYPVSAYLRTARTLTAVSVLIENSVPSKVVLRTVDEPPLKDFIDTPDLSSPDRNDSLRWNNGVLLDAKNRSLNKVLREESPEGLLSLVTRIERAILDLSEQAERAKDRAQSIVEKGQGDPTPERELAVLCRQRIEVLKPILAALKQAAAAGNP